MPVKKLVKSVGIPGVEPPKRTCDDPNCPWHGNIKVRGVVLTGEVVKAKTPRMVVVSHSYLYYSKKYKRYEKRSKKIHAYLPPCTDVGEGDIVVIGETRPISKTVKFVVLGLKKVSQ